MKCFNFCNERNVACQKKSCRHWIEHDASRNCTILSSQEGPKTLQEIGEIFGVTRMRICQLEKKILKKIYNRIDKEVQN